MWDLQGEFPPHTHRAFRLDGPGKSPPQMEMGLTSKLALGFLGELDLRTEPVRSKDKLRWAPRICPGSQNKGMGAPVGATRPGLIAEAESQSLCEMNRLFSPSQMLEPQLDYTALASCVTMGSVSLPLERSFWQTSDIKE